jgi:hypothetical protein
MTLKSLLGVASLFLALIFDGVVHAEVNAAIPSAGGQYFDSRVQFRCQFLRRMIPGGATFGLGHRPTR